MLLLSFWVECLLFVFNHNCSYAILNRHVGSGYPCLIPDFRGKYSTFSQLSELNMAFPHVVFIVFKYNPSIPNWQRFWTMKGCWNFFSNVENCFLYMILLPHWKVVNSNYLSVDYSGFLRKIIKIKFCSSTFKIVSFYKFRNDGCTF
jgi:hypothetical protein